MPFGFLQFMTIQLFLNIVGIILFCSGVSKLFNLKEFRIGLLYIPYVSRTISHIIAVFLPISEVVLAIGIIINIDIAKIGVILMCLVFCLVTLVILKNNLKVKCNCFMSSKSNFTLKTIYLNLFYIFIILFSFVVNSRENLVVSVLTSFAILIVLLLSLETYKNTKDIKSMISRNLL